MSDIFNADKPKLRIVLKHPVLRHAMEEMEDNLHIEMQEKLPSDTTYEICIDFNDKDDKKESLLKNAKSLCKKYPKLKESAQIPEECLQYIYDYFFQEGIGRTYYISNHSFAGRENGRELTLLGIRPEKYDNEIFPNGVTLIFKGHIWQREYGAVKKDHFIIDSISDVGDSECLKYEREFELVPYKNDRNVQKNFFSIVKDTIPSVTKTTEAKLVEWENYLTWRENLINVQLNGCKYYKVTIDEKTGNLIFHFVCENEEHFKTIERHIKRDVSAFANDYSFNQWEFDFIGKHKNERGRSPRYSDPVELGNFAGVVEKFNLKDRPELIGKQKTSNEEASTENPKKEDNKNKEITEADIIAQFPDAYIVKIAYKLNQDDLDDIEQKNIEEKNIPDYVNENILPQYYKNGFIAKSAIGDFALVGRFHKAINKLRKTDENFNPTLAQWLFDVKQAALPVENIEKGEDVKIEKWLNPNIASNENQKIAVQKMLNARDLFLLQGPPGTGKTTVIAEAIYQFVREGKRVLVTSQSNDAVDNALERLADTPEIRAVRIGQTSRKKKKAQEDEIQKFAEKDALKYFYKNIAKTVNSMWLKKWQNFQKIIDECDRDLLTITTMFEDIAKIENQLNERNEQRNSITDEIQSLQKSLNENKDKNDELNNAKNQLENFKKFVNGNFEQRFYFAEKSSEILEKHFLPLIKICVEKNILVKNITAASLVKNFFPNADKILVELKNASGKSSDGNQTLEELTRQLNEKKQELADCSEEDMFRVKKEYNDLKLQIDKLKTNSSFVNIPEDAKNLFTEKLIQALHSPEKSNAEKIIANFKNQIETFSESVVKEINSYINSFSRTDSNDLENQIKIQNGKLESCNEEIKKLNENLISKNKVISYNAKKYQVESQEQEQIRQAINAKKSNAQQQLDAEKLVREPWQNSFERLVSKINSVVENENEFLQDKAVYNDIYIKSCNVVGVSCTDRKLTEPDFGVFDVIIIDEVSKATPPELLIPLLKGSKAILVGDHRQLPPMFKEHENSYKEIVAEAPDELKEILTESNFEKYKNMITSSLFKEYFEKADNRIKHSLLTQYRMHSDISEITNNFYEHKLKDGIPKENEENLKAHNLTILGEDKAKFVTPNRHAYWIDSSRTSNGTKIFESHPQLSSSMINVLEKHMALELLKKIAAEYKRLGYTKENPKTVGVISFYQKQVNEIRAEVKKLKQKNDMSAIEIDVNTVDRFQGKEKNIIIVSLVRNKPNPKRVSEHVLAFERINVAFSRAQECLFILGAKDMYSELEVELPHMESTGSTKTNVYRNIISELNRKAGFVQSSKLISKTVEEEVLKEYKAYEKAEARK